MLLLIMNELPSKFVYDILEIFYERNWDVCCRMVCVRLRILKLFRNCPVYISRDMLFIEVYIYYGMGRCPHAKFLF